MSRRGENIRKRKDGRWEGRYKVGYKENGSTKYASVWSDWGSATSVKQDATSDRQVQYSYRRK